MNSFWIYKGRLEAVPGSYIDTAIKEAIELAATVEHGPTFTFDFNDVVVTVAGDSDASLIEREWWRALYGLIEKRVGPYPAVSRMRPPVKYAVGDSVEVVDSISGNGLWVGAITAIAKANGIMTVTADTALDRRGRPLTAKFSKSGRAVGQYGPDNRHIKLVNAPDQAPHGE